MSEFDDRPEPPLWVDVCVAMVLAGVILALVFMALFGATQGMPVSL